MSVKLLNSASNTVAPCRGEVVAIVCCEQIQGKADQASQKYTIFRSSVARHPSGALTVCLNFATTPQRRMVSEHTRFALSLARAAASCLVAECRVFTHLMLPVQLLRADKPHTVGLVKRRRTRSAAVVALALATIVLWTFLANIQVRFTYGSRSA